MIIKEEIDSKAHFQAYMKEWDTNINYLGVPNDAQKREYEALYTGLVYTLRVEQDRSSTSKLRSSLRALLPDMWAKYKDELLTFDDRIKFAYLYFLNFAVVNALEGKSDDAQYDGPYIPPKETTGSTDGLTFIQRYYTANGKAYSLWHSDIYYMFSRGESEEVVLSRRTNSLDELINYLEHQNRLIITAPNGRRYAIRKFNGVYKVNRDNGTILPKNF